MGAKEERSLEEPRPRNKSFAIVRVLIFILMPRRCIGSLLQSAES